MTLIGGKKRKEKSINCFGRSRNTPWSYCCTISKSISASFVYSTARFNDIVTFFCLDSLIRWNITELISAKRREQLSKLVISEDCLISTASKEKLVAHFPLQEKGLQLISDGKVAVVLAVNDRNTQGLAGDFDLVNSKSIETLPLNDERFIKVLLILLLFNWEVYHVHKLFSVLVLIMIDFDILCVLGFSHFQLPILVSNLNNVLL